MLAPRSDAEFWRIVDRVVDSEQANKQPRSLTWADGARREGFEPPTARSVAWCSTSIWTDPDGSGLLTLDGSSVQTAPDGYRRIVWMIKRLRTRNRMVTHGHLVERGDCRCPPLQLAYAHKAGSCCCLRWGSAEAHTTTPWGCWA